MPSPDYIIVIPAESTEINLRPESSVLSDFKASDQDQNYCHVNREPE